MERWQERSVKGNTTWRGNWVQARRIDKTRKEVRGGEELRAGS